MEQNHLVLISIFSIHLGPYAVKTAHPKIADSIYGTVLGRMHKPCTGTTQKSARPPMLYIYTGLPAEMTYFSHSNREVDKGINKLKQSSKLKQK
ncbi:hypothetical protein HYC85_024833 [Camellia sinensis]|uniref:Uncharacterized protein n=1 Tax=Camellia sinensis TaxID=4442 RepID=A0A7J7G9S6_CAMSI|nr:hypothetical protein HYC85_024833 [Camellia sinensis]